MATKAHQLFIPGFIKPYVSRAKTGDKAAEALVRREIHKASIAAGAATRAEIRGAEKVRRRAANKRAKIARRRNR